MNTQNQTTPKTRTRGALVIGVALASIITLAGCTPTPDPTPTTHSSTPTPTPTQKLTGVDAPKSEDEALDAGKAIYQKSLEVITSVQKAGGTDTKPLEQVSTGPALAQNIQSAQAVTKNQWKISGSLSFEFQKGYASELTAANGTKYPFSSVTLTGCQDASQFKVTLPDGTSPQRSANLRSIIEVTTVWDPTARAWFVQNVTDSGTSC